MLIFTKIARYLFIGSQTKRVDITWGFLDTMLEKHVYSSGLMLMVLCRTPFIQRLPDDLSG